MKKNIFYGAVISYDVIKKYYRDDESFHSFVFQQWMDDGDKENDHYKLIVYAIANDGCILNHDEPLPIKKLNERKHVLTRSVHFANIVLYRKELDCLYRNPESTAELKLFPESYDGTTYVSYSAETINSPRVSVKLDPCPPAPSR